MVVTITCRAKECGHNLNGYCHAKTVAIAVHGEGLAYCLKYRKPTTLSQGIMRRPEMWRPFTPCRNGVN